MYGPSLPRRFSQSAQSEHGLYLNHGSDHQSEQPEQVCSARAKKHSDKREAQGLGKNTYLSLHLQRRISPLFMSKGLLSPNGPF